MAKRFEDIALAGVLLPGVRLVVDPKLSNFILLTGTTFLEQIHLGSKEFAIMLALIETFPRGCTYEKLLALLKEVSQEEAELLLLSAVQREGKSGIERIKRPIRTVISRIRMDISPLGIDIRQDNDELYALANVTKRDLLYDRLMARLKTPDLEESPALPS